jgi:hypothetical protein
MASPAQMAEAQFLAVVAAGAETEPDRPEV